MLTLKGRDRVQVLLRNARQILNIVTATFPPSLFDHRRSASHCADSEIETLGCVWVAIMQKLKETKGDNYEDAEKLLIALAKVCFEPLGKDLSLIGSSGQKMLKIS